MSDIDEKLLDDDINIIDDVEELPTEPEAQDKVETPPTEEVEPEKEESTVDEGGQEKQPPVEEEAPETPTPTLTPITEDSLRSILSDLREEEYRSSREVEEVYRDIQSRYYPNGISRVLTDSKTGLEIRTAQDVIDLSENPDLTHRGGRAVATRQAGRARCSSARNREDYSSNCRAISSPPEGCRKSPAEVCRLI